MRLKYLFFILVVLLTAVWVILIRQISYPSHLLTYISEVLIVAILIYLIYFYNKVIKPYKIISNGMELLREQDFSSRLMPVGQIDADVIVDIFNRLMEQLKEERLQVIEQNRLLDLLIKASPMGVIIFDFDGYITDCNGAAARMLSCETIEDLIGKSLKELDTSLARSLATLGRDDIESVRLDDGRIFRCSYLTFLDHGFRHPFMLIESLTSEVIGAEKKAYEKVIRMISHEVNNTMACITSTLDSISSVLKGSKGMDNLYDIMKVCIERCYGMSKFVTNYSDVVKIPEPDLQIVDLNEEISENKIFLENFCTNRRIDLRMDLSPNKLLVKMDSSLFEQVLINIVKNAAESIGKDGVINIHTSSSPLELDIADNGKGIDKEMENKLFTPFFSTKPGGQGIGLTFIREVLQRHNWTYSLRTDKDGLTHFRIKFA